MKCFSQDERRGGRRGPQCLGAHHSAFLLPLLFPSPHPAVDHVFGTRPSRCPQLRALPCDGEERVCAFLPLVQPLNPQFLLPWGVRGHVHGQTHQGPDLVLPTQRPASGKRSAHAGGDWPEPSCSGPNTPSSGASGWVGQVPISPDKLGQAGNKGKKRHGQPPQ